MLVRQIWQQSFKLRVEFLHLCIFLSELIYPVLNGLAVTAVRALSVYDDRSFERGSLARGPSGSTNSLTGLTCNT